ncbi:DNA replication and repair protein RecO [Desulfobotulus alkaliphilus]|uniref:DNA repair protein RecO n=1 Tax=Desulfobotulus alkaliphilus TaxID=622671 RepID=A0A562RZ06_9BACT|nr:DNA repair protein RecO [Desulfobotulus alkaliphilus]TWI74379.1 DNA replication and repair protein RecO [Desulfobotulus alkaliphilus]
MTPEKSAIVMRHVEYGDYDVILTLFSRSKGKISVIAKNARKSRRRFSGRLELFSVLHPDCSQPKAGGIPVLREVDLLEPFENLRSDFIRMGYAAYWCEILCFWLEEGAAQPEVYDLLETMLRELHIGKVRPEILSLLLQLRFLTLAGLAPGLDTCGGCGAALVEVRAGRIRFDYGRSHILCGTCSPLAKVSAMAPGTVKTLCWLQRRKYQGAGRMQFSGDAAREGLFFLESFLSFHMGRDFRSLKFLRSVRSSGTLAAQTLSFPVRRLKA